MKKGVSISKKKSIPLIGGSYDFVDYVDMPSGTYTDDNIDYYGTDWAVMEDYDNIAEDHCGATTATNIALYYANLGHTNLKKNNSVDDTFVDLHSRIGDGPAPFIASDLKAYASDRGYTMTSSLVSTYNGLKTATQNDKACGVLLLRL